GDDHMKLVSQTLNSCLRIDVAHTRANHFGVRPELGITYIVVGTDFDNDIVTIFQINTGNKSHKTWATLAILLRYHQTLRDPFIVQEMNRRNNMNIAQDNVNELF
ncbi:hypothetical protein WICPIJ_002064, partial [Wickerhamomyces pijperi]